MSEITHDEKVAVIKAQDKDANRAIQPVEPESKAKNRVINIFLDEDDITINIMPKGIGDNSLQEFLEELAAEVEAEEAN